MKVVPDKIGPDKLNRLPFGLLSCTSTTTAKRSEVIIAGTNSTVQFRVAGSPAVIRLLVTTTETGAGTAYIQIHVNTGDR